MKRLFTLAVAAALLASLTACGSTANASDADYIYGQIASVSGNDIVLMRAEYNENADSDAADPTKDSGKDTGESKRERPEGFDKSKFSGEMPEGFDKSKFSGEMPEGFDSSNMPEGFDKSKFSGERPERGSRSQKSDSDEESGDTKRERPEGFDKSKFSGEMPEDFDPSNLPEGFEKPADGEKPEGFDKSKFGGSRPKSSGNSSYTLTGEQEELRVLVGIKVTTALGVETDFEVLKSGDMIKCSVEKDSDGNDVVTAVWLLEE